jgi:hypothetical protein
MDEFKPATGLAHSTLARQLDTLPPGLLLARLTEAAVGNLDHLSHDELLAVLRATRRLTTYMEYQQVLLVAEFVRRHRFRTRTQPGLAAAVGR